MRIVSEFASSLERRAKLTRSSLFLPTLLDMGTLTEEMQHLDTSDYMGGKCESSFCFSLPLSVRVSYERSTRFADSFFLSPSCVVLHHQSGNPCLPTRETTRITTTPSLSFSDEIDPPPSLLEPRRLPGDSDSPRGISTRLMKRSGSTATVKTDSRRRRLVRSLFSLSLSSASSCKSTSSLSSCRTHLS